MSDATKLNNQTQLQNGTTIIVEVDANCSSPTKKKMEIEKETKL